MPRFCFRRCGEGTRFFVEAPRSLYKIGNWYWFKNRLDGSEFKCRCIKAPPPALRCPEALGHTISVQAGVGEDQIEEARAADLADGFTGIDYTPEGDIVFRDRQTRKRYLEARMLYDKDAAYSGAQRLDAREREIRSAKGII